MKHGVPILHPLPPVRPLFVFVAGLLLTVLHGHPTYGAEVRKTKAVTAVKPVKCDKAPTPVDRLICLEPSLGALDAGIDPAFREYLDRATRPADRDARAAGQRLWLSRASACPSAAQPQSAAGVDGAASEDAVACLSRIYEQRLAVLRYERNAAAWPRIRFRPTIIEGAGAKLCDDLERDLIASFLGRGLFVNPLGEREIGFAAVPGLGRGFVVRRADIYVYNVGKPLPNSAMGRRP